jgi:hypothetical protein
MEHAIPFPAISWSFHCRKNKESAVFLIFFRVYCSQPIDPAGYTSFIEDPLRKVIPLPVPNAWSLPAPDSGGGDGGGGADELAERLEKINRSSVYQLG